LSFTSFNYPNVGNDSFCVFSDSVMDFAIAIDFLQDSDPILAFNLFAAIKDIPLRGYTLVNSANPL